MPQQQIRKPLPRIPSERKEELDNRANQAELLKKQQQERRAQLRSAAAIVAKTAEGQMLLAHLAQTVCGYNRSKSARRFDRAADGSLLLVDVSPHAAIHNAAREDVWLEMRTLFEKNQLNKIEG